MSGKLLGRRCNGFLNLPPKHAASDPLIKWNESSLKAASCLKTEIAGIEVGVGVKRRNRKKIRDVLTICRLWDFPTAERNEKSDSASTSVSASVWQKPRHRRQVINQPENLNRTSATDRKGNSQRYFYVFPKVEGRVEANRSLRMGENNTSPEEQDPVEGQDDIESFRHWMGFVNRCLNGRLTEEDTGKKEEEEEEFLNDDESDAERNMRIARSVLDEETALDMARSFIKLTKVLLMLLLFFAFFVCFCSFCRFLAVQNSSIGDPVTNSLNH